VRAVAYDTEHFSSRRIIVRETPPPRIPAPPITSDPPEHRAAKQVLLPVFTPDAIKRHEGRTRAICGAMIDRFAGKDGCDAAVAYAQEIPARVIAHMLGLPEEEGDRFRRWIHELLSSASPSLPP
jgi:cytochrome P450